MHTHHRQRVREKFEKEGFDSFGVHELLEALLFYSIPRANTNDTAHALMERFGSLKGIFDASIEELQSVSGIGLHSAMLLKMIPEIAKRYAQENDGNITSFDSVSKIAQYFCRMFIGLNHECLYMMLLNNRLQMIDCILISKGTVNSSAAPIRMMTEKALFKNASAVVLAHNHPNGLAIPSSNDLELTDVINNSFHMLGITLLEHIIVADDRFCPIMQQHCGKFRCSPISGKIESGFYDDFYDVDAKEWKAPPIFP